MDKQLKTQSTLQSRKEIYSSRKLNLKLVDFMPERNEWALYVTLKNERAAESNGDNSHEKENFDRIPDNPEEKFEYLNN